MLDDDARGGGHRAQCPGFERLREGLHRSLDNGFKREDSVKDIGALLDWIADPARPGPEPGRGHTEAAMADTWCWPAPFTTATGCAGPSTSWASATSSLSWRTPRTTGGTCDGSSTVTSAIRRCAPTWKRSVPLNIVEKMKVPAVRRAGRERSAGAGDRGESRSWRPCGTQGQPVWYMNALNEGHGYRKKENRDISQQVVIQFLQKYLLE